MARRQRSRSAPDETLTGLLITAGRAWHARRPKVQAAEIESHRRAIWEASFLPAADAMTGTQFEHFIADLLRMDGHRGVQLVGGPGDGGADILSVEASGRPVAVQCKRQMAPIAVGVVRQLNGTLSHEHPGRAGVLVTTALLTGPAAELAARAGLTVVDRNGLARWMAATRQVIERQAQPVPFPRPAPWPHGPAPPPPFRT
jgi:restriction system protein